MEGTTENTDWSDLSRKEGAPVDAGSSTCAPPFEAVAGLAPVSPLAVNATSLHHWRLTGYTRSDLWSVAQARDSKDMFMIASFDGSGSVSARVSSCTWQRQEGHYPTMLDVCSEVAHHPLLEGLKGDLMIWLEDGLWTWQREYSSRAPVFAFGRHFHDSRTLLIPDPAFWSSGGYVEEMEQLAAVADRQPWESRRNGVFFRGAASGLGFAAGHWHQTARGRLVLKANDIANPDLLDAKITRFSHLDEACRNELLKERVVDIEVPLETFGSYKYLVDADGYCCAWKSLFLKMALGSLVLKIESPYEQWYHHRLQPWKHYVPLAADLSDFEEVYAWVREHDDSAREIAMNGQQFVRSLLCKDALDEFAQYLKHLFMFQRAE
jgi:hypothetical protein